MQLIEKLKVLNYHNYNEQELLEILKEVSNLTRNQNLYGEIFFEITYLSLLHSRNIKQFEEKLNKLRAELIMNIKLKC